MLSLIKLIVAVSILYLGQSYYMMSTNSLAKFILKHDRLTMNDPDLACEDYSAAAVIDIKILAQTEESMITNKDEMCQAMLETHNAMIAIQANISSRIDTANMQVTSSFPWQEADIKFDSSTKISSNMVPTLQMDADNEITIKRTISSLKILKYSSIGTVINDK